MRAVIPVAGVGTRLRPFTYALPKVLLNVAGKPIIAHIMDAIIEQGISKATVITGYMHKLVEDYLVSHYSIEFDFVQQKESLGLGHAIWVGRETYDDEPLMIILGDTVFDVDLNMAQKSGYSSIGVKYVEDPRRFGVVLKEGDKISKLVEKPETPISNDAIVGLYYIRNTELLSSCLQELIDKNIRTRNEYQLTDALQLMLTRGEEFTTFPVEGWYDCGKTETLLSTNKVLLDKQTLQPNLTNCVVIPPVYIAPSATVESSVIGPYTTVADGATVKDSVVRQSIVSDDASVFSSLLEDSIIGNSAIVRGQFNRLNVGNSSEINYI